MTLEIRPSEGGTLVPLKVRPSAGRNDVGGEHGGALRVSVSAAPEKGKANRAVAEVLAAALGIPKSEVRIVTGETSAKKTAWVPLAPAEFLRRIGCTPTSR